MNTFKVHKVILAELVFSATPKTVCGQQIGDATKWVDTDIDEFDISPCPRCLVKVVE
jgi:hypothetical protein